MIRADRITPDQLKEWLPEAKRGKPTKTGLHDLRWLTGGPADSARPRPRAYPFHVEVHLFYAAVVGDSDPADNHRCEEGQPAEPRRPFGDHQEGGQQEDHGGPQNDPSVTQLQPGHVGVRGLAVDEDRVRRKFDRQDLPGALCVAIDRCLARDAFRARSVPPRACGRRSPTRAAGCAAMVP